jgi:hypothetical protein
LKLESPSALSEGRSSAAADVPAKDGMSSTVAIMKILRMGFSFSFSMRLEVNVRISKRFSLSG